MAPQEPPANGARAVYTLADLRTWSTSTAGVQPPIRLAVLGDPIAHSASPPMQNAALAACGLAARYTRLHIRPDELSEALGLLAPAGFIGANLTLPHKTAALPFLTRLDSHAASLGAVNTLRVEADGSLTGFNTDGPGFTQAVQADLELSIRGAHVLILGAGGGAGRAVAAQCVRDDCARLLLVNRTFEKARSLAETLGGRAASEVSAVPWEKTALAAVLPCVDLVVNTSSLGLKADDPLLLPTDILPPQARIFDTVYRRDGTPTPLLAAAWAAGLHAVGGQSLLLRQGALAFQIWFNQPAPLAKMRCGLAEPGAYQ